MEIEEQGEDLTNNGSSMLKSTILMTSELVPVLDAVRKKLHGPKSNHQRVMYRLAFLLGVLQQRSQKTKSVVCSTCE